MEKTELHITEYDPSTIPVDATVLIVGKRNTGKTTLTRDLLYHLRNKLEIIIGMNPTEMANHNLEFFIPKSMIFHSFDDNKLGHILEWQKRCIANGKGLKAGLIMDDCMSEKSINVLTKNKKALASNDVNKVFKLGRHLKLFFLNAMQYIKDAPPDIRGNVDILFVFNTSSGSEREKLWKEYFAMFPKFADFNKVFDECAQGFDCIVLDMRKSSINPSNCIFFYRAELHEEPFKVGKKIFWDLSEYYFTDRTDYEMDPSKVIGKRHTLIQLDSNDEKEKEKEKLKSTLKPNSFEFVVKKKYA